MRIYNAPEYKNEELMSKDVITGSVVYDYNGVKGLTQTVTNNTTTDEETGEVTKSQSVSYSYSISNFFNTTN